MRKHSTAKTKSDTSRAQAKKTRKRRKREAKISRRGYARLLNSRYATEITTRLKSGVSAEDIADWLHNECEGFQKVSEAALVRQLYRFRKTIPGGVIPNKAHLIEEWARERADGFNAFVVAVQLAVVQLHRLGQALEREQEERKLLPEVGAEIDRQSRLVQHVADSKLRLGILMLEVRGLEESPMARRTNEVLAALEKEKPGSRAELVRLGHKLGMARNAAARRLKLEANPSNDSSDA